jgi:hypothetical protein
MGKLGAKRNPCWALATEVDLDVFLALNGAVDRKTYWGVSRTIDQIMGDVGVEIVEWAIYGNESTPVLWDAWEL